MSTVEQGVHQAAQARKDAALLAIRQAMHAENAELTLIPAKIGDQLREIRDKVRLIRRSPLNVFSGLRWHHYELYRQSIDAAESDRKALAATHPDNRVMITVKAPHKEFWPRWSFNDAGRAARRALTTSRSHVHELTVAQPESLQRQGIYAWQEPGKNGKDTRNVAKIVVPLNGFAFTHIEAYPFAHLGLSTYGYYELKRPIPAIKITVNGQPVLLNMRDVKRIDSIGVGPAKVKRAA